MTTTKPRKPYKKQEARHAYSIPSIDLVDAQRAYFIYNNAIHSVRFCSTSIFKEAILSALNDTTLNNECNALMMSSEIDMVSRWFLLNSLWHIKKPLKLYSSAEDAQRSLVLSSVAV
jgi:hypothetical protein